MTDFPLGEKSAHNSAHLSNQPKSPSLIGGLLLSLGSSSSIDFAHPRLNFMGNCSNWRRLFPLSLANPFHMRTVSLTVVCRIWLPCQSDFSLGTAAPPADNDTAIRRSNSLPPPSSSSAAATKLDQAAPYSFFLLRVAIQYSGRFWSQFLSY